MIGVIKTDSWTATLEDEGKWTCTDAFIARGLNLLHSLEDYSPADGARGHKVLHQAAEKFNAKVVAIEKKTDPPGDDEIVY